MVAPRLNIKQEPLALLLCAAAGFWYQYHNIFSLLRELGGEWPLTDWTTSGFWNPQGLVTEAPVFSKQTRLPTLVGCAACVGWGDGLRLLVFLPGGGAPLTP